MAPLLDAVPEPLMHGVGSMPHAALQGAFDALYPPGEQWYWRADFVNEIPDEAVQIHAEFGAAMPTMKSTMHMYPIDGAAHDVASGDTAWSYRDATWGSVFAGVDPDPANVATIRHWSIDYFEALHPYSAGGAYVNMMMDEGQERVRASYRGNYDGSPGSRQPTTRTTSSASTRTSSPRPRRGRVPPGPRAYGSPARARSTSSTVLAPSPRRSRSSASSTPSSGAVCVITLVRSSSPERASCA